MRQTDEGRQVMDKANKPLALSKDIVKELQRLAVEADTNEADAVEARRRYERAEQQALSSASQFAIALYDFTLAYADAPKLIEEKLKEFGRQVKSTSSVYNNIARVAFDHFEEGDAKRNRISRYASLIEKAHKQCLNATAFKKLVASGLKNAERRLLGTPPTSDPKTLKKARDLASKLFNNYIYEISDVKLNEDVQEGSELQLLAEYRNGKIVVYGLVPPNISNTDAVLAKLIASTVKPQKAPYDLMRDMQKAIKLVAKPTDEKATATYKVKDGKVHFIVEASGGSSAISASGDFDIFKKNITLPVATWSRVLSTLVPLVKHITSFDVTPDYELVLAVDEREIPDIGAWSERKRHSISIGKASGANLLIPLKSANKHLEEQIGRWELLATVSSSKVPDHFKHTPFKKYVAFESGSSSLKFSSVAKKADSGLYLTKQSYRQLKSASAKMKGWASELSFEKRQDQLRVSAVVVGDIIISAYVGVE